MLRAVFVSFALIPFLGLSAGGINPVNSKPEILESIEEIQVTVKGATNGSDTRVVEEVKQRIESSLTNKLTSNDIQQGGTKPAHLTVLFRITGDGPQYNAHIWTELYDDVVHERSGQTTKAQLWGIDHVVVETSRDGQVHALVRQASQDCDQILALYYKARATA